MDGIKKEISKEYNEVFCPAEGEAPFVSNKPMNVAREVQVVRYRLEMVRGMHKIFVVWVADHLTPDDVVQRLLGQYVRAEKR